MGSRHAIPGFRTIAAVAALLHLGMASTTSAQTLAGLDAITPSFVVLKEVNPGNLSAVDTTADEVSHYANLEFDLSFDFDPDSELTWELPQPEPAPLLFTSGLVATWQDRSGWGAGGSVFNPATRDQAAFGLHKTASNQSIYSSDLEHPSLFTAGLGYAHDSGWRFGADVHLIEMVDTGGLDREGYSTDVNAMAIQWRSSPVVALGGVVPLGDDFRLSSGFTWNRNQVRPLDHAFNALAPGLVQSSFHVGLHWQWNENVQWFLNYRSGSADYLSDESTSALTDLAGSHAEDPQNVVSLTVGVELSL
jgi:hypothetical protein